MNNLSPVDELEGGRRTVHVMHPEMANPPFPENYVKNSKYTLNPISLDFFLWKNLFEQFQRKANLYFLVIGGLQLIPGLSPTGQYTTLSTLLAVVFFSMLKAGYEDYQRHIKDHEMSSRTAFVLREVDGVPKFVAVEYTKVQVGDIVRVVNMDGIMTHDGGFPTRNNAIPCDLVLLTTSDKEGVAYVETSNLDGETNLKSRQCIDHLRLLHDDVRPVTSADVTPQTEHLAADMLIVNGSLQQISQDFGESGLGSTSHSGFKKGKTTAQRCAEKYDGSVIECELPNGNLYTFSGTIRLKGDGEGGDEVYSVTPSQMLYRGSSLRKVTWVVGVCVFTGPETKVAMNARKPPHKSSRVESLVNYLLIAVLLLQLIMCVAGAVVLTLLPENMWYLQITNQNKAVTFFKGFVTFLILFNNLIPISLYVTLELIRFFQGKLMEWDLCMYYSKKDMPASAKSTDINEELGQVSYIFSDKTGTLTMNVMTFLKFTCFGEKFGTGITEIGRSAARRRGVELVDERPEEVLQSDFPFFDPQISDDAWWKHPQANKLREFFTILGVCHTVVMDGGKMAAESPDEEALVKAANMFGIEFVGRTSETLTLQVGAARIEEKYRILETIAFDSDRKRMSVLVQFPKNQGYRLLTKGADSVVLKLLGDASVAPGNTPDVIQKTVDSLEEFGNEGLRTLLLASREVPEREALSWASKYRSAKNILGDDARRIETLSLLAKEIERDLELVGATAIEDKLQEKVSDCIEAFHKGGIKVWMLTGDKVETAENIAYACSLVFTDCRLTRLKGDTFTKAEMIELLRREKRTGLDDDDTCSPPIPPGAVQGIVLANETTPADVFGGYESQEAFEHARLTKPHSILIDGDALQFILDDNELRDEFYNVIRHCVSVVCCRVSPKQKAMVVALVRENEPGAVTLAVGDGANDVPMIQSAHVGVGISGMEGQQAANSADYAIGQFRFLHRLLFVHGRSNYSKLARVINYFFYKNAILVMTQFWFCIFNRFTGQSLYEKWTLSGYNVAFTSIPIIVFGALDRDILNTNYIHEFPQLYKAGIHGKLLNVRLFILWLFNAIYHSLIIFFVFMFGWGGSGILPKGNDSQLDGVGIVIYAAVVIVVNVKLALHVNSFTWLHHLTIWGSIVFFFVYCVIYALLPVSLTTTMKDIWSNVLSFSTPWIMLALTVLLCFVADFAVVYGAFNLAKLSFLRAIQIRDSNDPMAAVRPPKELAKRRKTPQPITDVEQDASELGSEEMKPTLAAEGDAGKDQVFTKHALGDEDDIDPNQDIFLQFIDMDLEDEFVEQHLGRKLIRYKFALGLAAVASLILFGVSIANVSKKNGVLELCMWGLFSAACWIGFIILLVTNIRMKSGLHTMLLLLMIASISGLSIANLTSSQREPDTHPVTMGVLLLGLLTVLRPPLIQAFQYVIICTVGFTFWALIFRVSEWTGVDIAIRVVEVLIVAITSLIALAVAESFSRRMFISQKQVFIANKAAMREENRSLILLGNVLPSAIVQDVRINKRQLGQFSMRYEQASTLNSDIVKFTNFSSTKEPHVVVEMLNKMFTYFDGKAKRLGLEKIKTIGDAYVCAAGIPIKDFRHQEKIIMMGLQMINDTKALNAEGLTTLKDLNIEIRVGVATGYVDAGVVGMQKVCYDVFGEAAELSELNEQNGLPSRVHIDPRMNNEVTQEFFTFEQIDGRLFVKGVIEDSDYASLFKRIRRRDYLRRKSTLNAQGFHDASTPNSTTRAPSSVPRKSIVQIDSDTNPPIAPAKRRQSVSVGSPGGSDSEDELPVGELARDDIYSFLEDEDKERQWTIRLWANFAGEMNVGTLTFKSEVAEEEYGHYIRFLAVDRFTPEVIQGTYLFVAAMVLLLLFFRSIVNGLIIAALAVAIVHAVVVILHQVIHLRRRQEKRRLKVEAKAKGEGSDSDESDDEGINIGRNLARRGTLHQTPPPEDETRIVVGGADGVSTFDPADVDKHHVNLAICTPIRAFAFLSGACALVLPVASLFVLDYVSVVDVFIILAGQCYVLSMLHSKIVFKFFICVAHFIVVTVSFAYVELINPPGESFSLFKDGGNYLAIVFCYVLTFMMAFILEQNVRKSFAAAKNVIYQNAETQSAVALCDKLLNNVLPAQIVTRMKEFPDRPIVDEVPDASVLFVYTDGLHPAHEEAVGPDGVPRPRPTTSEVVMGMNAFLWILDNITLKYGVEKIKTTPFLVVSGCPERNTDHPQRLAMCARDILAAVAQFNIDTGSHFKIKVGIHTGKVTAGVLGSTKFLYDVFGDTVNFASRLTSSAEWGTVQLSSETALRLSRVGILTIPKGTIELKGKGKQEIHLLNLDEGRLAMHPMDVVTVNDLERSRQRATGNAESGVFSASGRGWLGSSHSVASGNSSPRHPRFTPKETPLPGQLE